MAWKPQSTCTSWTNWEHPYSVDEPSRPLACSTQTGHISNPEISRLKCHPLHHHFQHKGTSASLRHHQLSTNSLKNQHLSNSEQTSSKSFTMMIRSTPQRTQHPPLQMPNFLKDSRAQVRLAHSGFSKQSQSASADLKDQQTEPILQQNLQTHGRLPQLPEDNETPLPQARRKLNCHNTITYINHTNLSTPKFSQQIQQLWVSSNNQYDSFQTLLPTLFYMSVTTSLRC